MFIDMFRGISPRTPEHRLGKGVAIRAHNVNLSRGTLAPWRETKPVAVVDSNSMTLFNHGCCYIGYPTCVNVAPWLPDTNRFFITGRSGYPEVGTLSNCEASYTRLGVPVPHAAPSVSASAPDTSIETAFRSYVFTYVNKFGEEGAPSFPSEEVAVDNGAAVVLSGWSVPSEEYAVTSVRLYRTATGFKNGAEKTQDFTTTYLMVAEFAITQTEYTDTMTDSYLGCALETREVQPPPAALKGITVVDDTAILAGFVGNKVYFSRNNQPHNWPSAQELTLDHNIVSMTSDNGNLYITTAGTPYIIDGVADCSARPVRNVIKMDYPYADIACGYTSSRVITPFGLVYVSNEGLVLFSGRSAPILVTDSVLSPKEWASIAPNTARLAYWQGWLFCITDVVSFMFLLDTTTYRAQSQIADMITISDTPLDMRLSSSGALLFLNAGGAVHQWDAGNRLRPYEWTTTFRTGTQTWFPLVAVDVDGNTELTVTTDRGASFTRSIASERLVRGKRLGRSKKYYIHFTGTGEVNRLRMGVTYTEEAAEDRGW